MRDVKEWITSIVTAFSLVTLCLGTLMFPNSSLGLGPVSPITNCGGSCSPTGGEKPPNCELDPDDDQCPSDCPCGTVTGTDPLGEPTEACGCPA